MTKTFKVFFSVLILAYPVAVFLGFKYLSVSATNWTLLFLFIFRFFYLKHQKSSFDNFSLYTTLGMFCICLSGAILGRGEFVKLYPVLVNCILGVIFFLSLREGKQPIVEKLARLKEKSLSDKGVLYTRKVTVVWILFFIMNGTISFLTYLYASLEQWTFYNAFLSYILIGTLMTVEFLFRQIVRRSWGEQVSKVEIAQNGGKLFLNRDGSFIPNNDFKKEINKIKKYFKLNSITRVAIGNLDPFSFSSLFFASISLGVEVIMLPNNQEGTIVEHDGEFDIYFNQARYDEIELSGSLECVYLLDSARVSLFTSGSSGRPEKIEKKFSHLRKECKILDETFGARIQESVIYSTVSPQHIYGLLFRIVWPILSEKALANFNVEFLEDFHQFSKLSEKIDRKISLVSSPAFLKRLDESSSFKGLLTNVFSSGGRLNRNTQQLTLKFFGTSPLEIYGSTETGGIAFRNQELGESWKVFPQVDISIDERSCLGVKSPFISGGFFQTNDLIEIEGDQFNLKGRVDRIYKIEEKRVSLNNIEEALRKNKNVADAHCVVLEQGERDIIGCLVILAKSSSLQRETKLEKVKFLKSYLSQFFWPILLPKKFRFLEEFPYNEQSKLTKKRVLELFYEQ